MTNATVAKSFVTVAGLTFLSSKYVFSKSNKTAALSGLIAGGIMLALLQIKTTEEKKTTGATGATSPSLPELDNTRGNLNPETLPPIVFRNNAPLTDSALAYLDDVVTEPAEYLAGNPNLYDTAT